MKIKKIYKILVFFLILLILNVSQVLADENGEEYLKEETYRDENGDCNVKGDDLRKVIGSLDTDNSNSLSTAELKNATDREIGMLYFHRNKGEAIYLGGKFDAMFTTAQEDAILTELNSRREKYGLPPIVDDTTGHSGYTEYYPPKRVGSAGTTGSNLENIMDSADEFVESANDTVNVKENFQYMYELEDSIETKIEKVATKIYGAKEVIYEEKAKEQIRQIEELGYGKLPVCIAKTQYSFSDDPKNLECKGDYPITIREIDLKAGAGFVVALAGKIFTMPGLPKVPAAETIDIDEKGEIKGIF